MNQPSGDVRQETPRQRSGELVTGDWLLVVGGADGSEFRPCPPEWRPQPRRVVADSARPTAAAVGPLALGGAAADQPLLDREADVAQLLGLLAEGRSVRLVGQGGSGRTALLGAVADAAGELAPDGVVRLTGHRRTSADLLQDLYAATHRSAPFRPDRDQLRDLLAPLGAVVVIDDVEPSGPELEELVSAAPDCAFLISVAPGSPQLPPGSRLLDHLVGGLSRPACLGLIARLAGRPLDEHERAWAIDLWFESEGLPLRFVQAAALLRQRDAEVDTLVAEHEDRGRVFGLVKEIPAPEDPAELEGELRRAVPLPSVAESAAPTLRLAAGLSEAARSVLLLAVALGGECPTAPHLPALIDVGLGESALQELTECGLAVSIGGHHRLTDGVLETLAEAWEPGEVAFGAARHFSWWVGHSSVSPAQLAAEAEVVIGALLADQEAGRPQEVLALARAAAPAFALSLRWGAWEQVLEIGLEAARALGSTGEEAWFHQELGVLAACTGVTGPAVGELEAALSLRAAMAETRGTAAGRRMLALLRAGSGRAVEGPDRPGGGRRPVIRAIAAQVPLRFRSIPKGGRRRTAVLAGAAVLAVGVLGTAVGLSLARTDEPGRGGGNGVVDEGVYTGDVKIAPSGSPSAPASPGPTPSASEPEPSPSPSASTSTSPSPSKSGTRKPSSTPSASRSTSAPTSQQPNPPQPSSSRPTAPSTPPPSNPGPSSTPTPTPSATPTPTPTPPSPTPTDTGTAPGSPPAG